MLGVVPFPPEPANSSSPPVAAPGPRSGPTLLGRLQALLTSPRGPYLTALLAFVISLPALGFGYQSDDHILRLQLEHGERPWGLFRASEEMLLDGRATGAIAWWASPRLAFTFFRPLSSLSHYVEFRWWPDAPWLMSLVNILVYAGCVLFAALLYRRLADSLSTAAFASVLFAVNEACAMSVGWISGRNTLLALLGSLAALYFHLRARAERRPSLQVASVVAVALALLSAEAGLWGLGLLVAYATTLEAGGWRVRLTSIAPQLAVGVLWTGVYLALGCGVHGSSFYRELSRPLDALVQGILDLPLSVMSLFGPSVAGFALLMPVHLARLLAFPVAALCAWLVWPTRITPSMRFFALSTLLCALPAFLTVGQDRVLIGASLGAFGWIAAILAITKGDTRLRARTRRVALIGIHLVLSLLVFPMNLDSVGRFENGTRALVSVIEPGRQVVLVNSPIELLSNYTLAVLNLPSRGEPAETAVHQLYTGGSELWLERIDERTLDVTATRGWGHAPIERIFCAPDDMPKLGNEVRQRDFAARVESGTETGMPERVRFSFPTALEGAERQWLVWQGKRPVAFVPPAIGARVRLAAMSPLEALAR